MALHGLMVQGGVAPDCPYPSNERQTLNIVTWAHRYNSTHPNRDLIKHELKAVISFGTPLLHQVVMAEGVTNRVSFRPGLKLLLDRGADINKQDQANGYTALHLACLLCRTALIDFLLERGAQRDIRASNGKTATEMMPKWCKKVIRPTPGVVIDADAEDEDDS